jgi:hypothetical protein
VLSVVLLALMGYQLPKLMGGSTSSSTSAVPPATIAADSLPGAGAVSTLPPGQLPNTDHVAVDPGSTKLISFGLFKSKDPFVQQLSTLPGAVSPAPAGAPVVTPATALPVAKPTPSAPPVTPAPAGSLTPLTPTPATLDPGTKKTSVTTPTSIPATAVTPITPIPLTTTPAGTATTPKSATAAPQAAPASVAISTNNTCENVNVDGTFPGNEDIFRVVSIGKDGKTVKIGVVGGAYDSGDATATIKLGERVTLVNTADGTRYVIVLETRCDAGTPPAPAPSPATGGAAPAAPTSTVPTSTVAPPPPTSTVTTPIVTDSLDTTTPTP